MKILLKLALTILAPIIGALAGVWWFWIVTKCAIKCAWSAEHRKSTMRQLELIKDVLGASVETLERRMGRTAGSE